jgi:aminopeptidase N
MRPRLASLCTPPRSARPRVSPALAAGCLALSLSALACGGEPASASGQGAASAGGQGGQGQGGMGGAPPTGELDFFVTRLEYDFDLATREATSHVSTHVLPPGGDCIRLPSELAVDTALWDGEGEPIEATIANGADGAFVVLCGEPIGGCPLDVVTTQVVPEDTDFGLDVGFSQTESLAGSTFSYLLSWVGGCDNFGPCDDSTALLVPLVLRVTHAESDVVLCPGALERPSPTETVCRMEGTRAPTYSGFALMSDPAWVEASFDNTAGVDLRFFEVPGGALASSLDPESVSALFVWLEALLGPLPYGPELRVAGAPTAWLGFEHPANIVLREDMPLLSTAYADTTFHVFAHEVVHQWAGDRTTLATPVDFAWKEAIAEYLTYVFEDEARPPGEAAASLAYWDQISLSASYHVRPTDEPAPAVEDFYGDVYGPGPMTLFVQLEPLVGRAAVLAGIASFLAGPGARSVSELRARLETESGADLTAYFDAWVFGAGAPEWPRFVVTTTPDGDGDVTVEVTQEGLTGPVFPCVVEVELVGQGGASLVVPVSFGLAPSSPTASVTVPFAEPVVDTLVDPGHRVIDRDEVMLTAPTPTIWIF